MKNERTDRVILQKIVGYCDTISELTERFGKTFDNYVSDNAFQLSCSMCIIQIGELTTRLSNDFIARHSDVPWREIKAMRNIHAHDYENVDLSTMWETLTEDIPKLRDSLKYILDDAQ